MCFSPNHLHLFLPFQGDQQVSQVHTEKKWTCWTQKWWFKKMIFLSIGPFLSFHQIFQSAPWSTLKLGLWSAIVGGICTWCSPTCVFWTVGKGNSAWGWLEWDKKIRGLDVGWWIDGLELFWLMICVRGLFSYIRKFIKKAARYVAFFWWYKEIEILKMQDVTDKRIFGRNSYTKGG